MRLSGGKPGRQKVLQVHRIYNSAEKRTEKRMKFRVHAKNSSVLIKGKPSFGEKINEREADYLVNSSVPGFFSISYDGKKQLVYEAPCTMVLAKYLKETKLSEAAFWKIMAQMLDVQIAAKSRGLYPEHLCVRPDMVFLEEGTLQMYFLYQPVTGAKETADSLFAVIHDMIYEELKKEGGKGQDYIIDFQNYLKQGDYRLEHVRQYIAQAAGGGRPPVAGHAVPEPDDADEDLEQYTVMLGSGGAPPVNAPKCVYLTRIRTKETAALSDEIIKIGRSSQNTYCVTGNASVGRVHAAIVRRGDVCALKDMGSVNGTSVNGKRLGENQACRLQSGDRIQLADEEFLFELK